MNWVDETVENLKVIYESREVYGNDERTAPSEIVIKKVEKFLTDLKDAPTINVSPGGNIVISFKNTIIRFTDNVERMCLREE